MLLKPCVSDNPIWQRVSQAVALVCAVELATPGSVLVIRNSKVDMFRGSMRLVTTQWGKVELADSTTAMNVKVISRQ